MKRLNLKLLLSGLCGFFLINCSQRFINVNYSGNGFSVNELKSSKVALVASEKVTVLEFRKAYDKKFQDSDSCRKFISGKIVESINKGIPEINVSGVDAEYSNVFDIDNLNAEALAKVDGFFKSTDSKYVINIKNIIVSNAFIANPATMMAAPPGTNGAVSGGMVMGTGGTTESCVISYDVEIWDSKTREKKLSFNNRGESKVSFFAYGKALNNAFENSFQHLIGYLKTQQVDFKK
ncbi:MAG: hypothetical protein JWO30_3274 [Fibrobacteres bacterium]|nr:hypothetical protein [Fibrobacterota bacterium]